ncbi:MAG: hypothetical protein MJ196_05915 [Treponemataceae bacterium]|nr:hypothetical protein [Treponemataceae bacterium]
MQVFFVTILKETNARWLPVHAANAAAMLQNAGLSNLDFSLLDLSFDEAAQSKKTPAELLSDSVYRQYAKNGKKQKIAVIFSLFSWNVAESLLCVEKIKEKAAKNGVNAGDLTFIAMGENVSARFECSKNVPAGDDLAVFDFLIAGEAETACLNLVKELLACEAGAKNAKSSVKNRIRFGIEENLEKLPSPWLGKVIDPVTYNGAVLQLSRAGAAPRNIPVPRIEKELEIFARKRVPDVFVLDDNFGANKDRALQFLRLFGKKLGGAHFCFNLNAQSIDKQLAAGLAQLACSLQIEFNNARNIDRKAFSKKIAVLNDFDLAFGFNLVYGAPDDTLPSFKESVDFALSLYPNNLEFCRFNAVNGSRNYQNAQKAGLKIENKPPYFVQHAPTFSSGDLVKAEHLAFACDVFYSCGRAVGWFLPVLQPLRIKPSQFLTDFAEWQRCNNCAQNTGFNPNFCSHQELERMQLSFLQFKYEEKHLSYAIPAMADMVRLNGALARLWGEGEESVLELSYNPEDIMSPEAANILAFVDQACMEDCKIRTFIGDDGPDFEYL